RAPAGGLPTRSPSLCCLALKVGGPPTPLAMAGLVAEKSQAPDHPPPAGPRPLHSLNPTPAAADHEHGGARLHPRARGDGAHAGGDATAHEGGLRPRHLLADGYQHLGGTHHRLSEGADARHLVHVLTLVAQAMAAIEHGPARGLVPVAEYGAADRAVETAPALRTEGEDHVIARLHVLHPGRHFLDDARWLVAEDHGQGELPVAVHDVPVA